MDLTQTTQIGLAVVLLAFVGGIAIVVIWARHRWSKLKPELFPVEETSSAEDRQFSAPSRSLGVGTDTVTSLLARAISVLQEQKTPEAVVAVSAIQKLVASIRELTTQIYSLMGKALDTAEIQSLVIGDGRTYAYVVVVPNRHEHPHMLGRYTPFLAGWRQHLCGIRASLAASGEFANLTCLLLFLSPSGKDSAFLVSHATTDLTLIPAVLLQRGDLKLADVRTLDAFMEFDLV